MADVAINTRIKFGDEILNLVDTKIVRKVTKQNDGISYYEVQFFEVMINSQVNAVPSYFYTFATQSERDDFFDFVVTQLNPVEFER